MAPQQPPAPHPAAPHLTGPGHPARSYGAPPTRRRPTPVFGVVYLTAAVCAVVAVFLPLWSPAPGSSEGTTDLFSRMSLWDGAQLPQYGGRIALYGLVLGGVLVLVLLLAAALARRTAVPGVVAALLCVPAIVLLLVKPYSSTPKPGLGAGGWIMLALAVVVVVTAVAHVATAVARRRPRAR